jgi:hypothetical protein
MRRYLDKAEAKSYLNAGKTIEVFLGRANEDKEIISYLSILKTKDNLYRLHIIEQFDEGDLNYTDVYSFSFVDPDMEFPTHFFDNFQILEQFISESFGLVEIKFVNSGIIQSEYEDLLKSESEK